MANMINKSKILEDLNSGAIGFTGASPLKVIHEIRLSFFPKEGVSQIQVIYCGDGDPITSKDFSPDYARDFFDRLCLEFGD